jgi:hypothetical protein
VRMQQHAIEYRSFPTRRLNRMLHLTRVFILHKQIPLEACLRPSSSQLPATILTSLKTSPYAAIVTSTSTPASMLIMICFTTSVGAFRSISRLWMRISNISQVLLPSPHGVFRVVTFRVFVGRRTGPLTRRFLDLARSRSSVHTFSSEVTLREVSVMRILWIFCGSG